ncbi:MAG: aromatic ring-hydroxylating dioxygenase subunit alpha [Burkholderiales bacterium]|nr:MAG: aromatic ring-hydroxylating dioxygenase subunit alpha [Burkholderiales bacterium]
MNQIATAAQFRQTESQLPVAWYFDERRHQLEMERLFAAGPGYVGHELMVPELNDYLALDWCGGAQALVRGPRGLGLVSNICRHRQAIMLKGRGNRKTITCPIHRWTYDLEGKLLGAPHFPEKPCLDLRQTSLASWQGLLFSGPREVSADLAGMALPTELDFRDFVFDRAIVHECKYNWKTFIEVYLEDYHVQPFHPGLGHFVTCNDLQWQFGSWWSLQSVGLNPRFERPGSPVYERWHDAVRGVYGPDLPGRGAVWMTYFPNLMVEWYPHVLVISTLYPRGIHDTTNVVEFYYPRAIAERHRDFIEAEQAAYMETAIEDDEIAERMDAGRMALLSAGRNEVGPYQSPMEDGMRHFHEFLRRELGDQR